jgi:hypothetical protein
LNFDLTIVAAALAAHDLIKDQITARRTLRPNTVLVVNKAARHVSALARRVPLRSAGYRPFLIFAASSVCASAKVRTIAAANAANALGVGWVIEGFAGQTTRTAAGIESGWTSSMISWSPERVSCPLAR